MKHYYLVDFENVADAGLEGFFQLSAEDTVYLFYSSKSNRINIDFIQRLLDGQGQANLRFLSVASGNQALDLQLASFLGSLISRGCEDCQYTIVSRDKGFGVLRSFWSNHAGLTGIQQVSCIAEARPPKPPVQKPEPVKAPLQKAEPVSAPVQKAEPVSAPVQKAEPEKTEAEPVSQPETAAPMPEPAPVVQEEKPQEAPAVETKAADAPEPEQRPEPQKDKKPAPAAQNRSSQQNGAAKQALNTSVQQALSKAKYEDKIISPVASLVSKSFGDKKIRQTVYRELIKLYGQKLGLEVYNTIKPLL